MNEFTDYTPVPAVNPVTQAVKNAGGSALFLIAVITYTITAILTLTDIILPNAAVSDALRNAALMEPEVYEYLPVIRGFITAICVVAFIPTFLTCLGYWMCFASAKSSHSTSTGGLTLLQAGTIIRLIGMSALLLLLAILAIPMTMYLTEYATDLLYGLSASDLSYSYSASTLRAAILLVFVILLAFLILYIVYYAKAIGTISRIKTAALGTFPYKQVSMFVIVMNFIIAALTLITTLSDITELSISSAASDLLNICFRVFLAIVLIQLRNQLNTAAMMTPPTPPVYPQDTQYQPNFQPQNTGYQPQMQNQDSENTQQ